MNKKTIKIREETWKELSKRKIDRGHSSLNETIKELLSDDN